MLEQTGVKSDNLEEYTALGTAEVVQRHPWGVRLVAAFTTVEITVLAPDLFRVGMFPDGLTPDYSTEAIAFEDWGPLPLEVAETDGGLKLLTEAAFARIDLNPIRIGYGDHSGRTFAEDDAELGMGFRPPDASSSVATALGSPVHLYKRRSPNEHYFACGERTGGLEKTGTRQIFWNINPPHGHTDSFNNLYTSIPFVLAMEGGKAWGLFLDSPARSEFDLGRESPERSRFSTECGSLIYYVFCGPTPRKVLGRYTELTGRTPMPPMWALGHHQSRYSYETAGELGMVARQFRKRDIPCDALYLDIDYMDGYRVFTWDKERFPHPQELVSELREQGFRTVTIVDPGVKVDENYSVYVQGREKDLYCKTRDGEEYHNVVWPGLCAFPDFTRPETREWWGENHRALLDTGVAGIWCDMNEPALFVPFKATMPDDVVHHGGGEAKLHAQVHNLYGNLMARSVHEGLVKQRPDERPFVITRSGYAGVQRWASQWTGDNSSWWEHLWMSMPQLQNMGLSGVAWAGVDVGGHVGEANGDLLARWYEFGVFQPYCRNHYAKDVHPQEPWAFGEPYESVCRKMIKLRMRLLPYLYTLFEECHRTGAPILRPLLFEHPDDEVTYTADDEFLLGEALLVAPITRPGTEHRHVYLPQGTWFHYWTGERFTGPAHILAHAPLGEPPLYVRANTAVAMGPERNHTAEGRTDPLTLLVYPAAYASAGEATLYEDAGDGYGHENGEYARRTITCEMTEEGVTVRVGTREGSFQPERREVLLQLRGVEGKQTVELDGEGVEPRRSEDGVIVVVLEEKADETKVEVRF